MSSEDGSVKFVDEIPFFLVIPWKTTTIIGVIILFTIIITKIFRKKFAIVKKNK